MEQKLVQIRFREDTAENFNTVNPVLASSEPARELDTGFFKLGDGKTAWNDLPYINNTVMEDLVNTLVARVDELEQTNNYNNWLLNALENNLQEFVINCSNDTDLLNASKHGGNCRLTSNINTNDPFTISQQSIVLDLNQKDLASSAACAIRVLGNNLTIKSQGNVSGDSRALFINNNNSKVTIIDGNYFSQKQSVIELRKGVCEIHGGLFKLLQLGENVDYNKTLLIVDSASVDESDDEIINKEIIIKGGSFYKFNPSNAEDSRIKIAEGYQVTQDGDFYTVSLINN